MRGKIQWNVKYQEDKVIGRFARGLILIGLALWSPSFIAASSKDARDADALWQVDGTGKRELDFIPTAVLNRELLKNFESLRLPSRSAEMIGQTLRYSREQAALGKSRCSTGVQGALPAGEGVPNPEGLDALQQARIVIVGKVDHLVDGLRADGEAATLVHIRVTRLMKGEFTFHVGDDISFLENIGRTLLGGTELCTESAGYRLPRIGEEILVAGDPDPVNPQHLISNEHQALFVEHDVVAASGHDQMPLDHMPLTQLDRLLNPEVSR